jgi:hypothetical protein
MDDNSARRRLAWSGCFCCFGKNLSAIDIFIFPQQSWLRTVPAAEGNSQIAAVSPLLFAVLTAYKGTSKPSVCGASRNAAYAKNIKFGERCQLDKIIFWHGNWARIGRNLLSVGTGASSTEEHRLAPFHEGAAACPVVLAGVAFGNERIA